MNIVMELIKALLGHRALDLMVGVRPDVKTAADSLDPRQTKMDEITGEKLRQVFAKKHPALYKIYAKALKLLGPTDRISLNATYFIWVTITAFKRDSVVTKVDAKLEKAKKEEEARKAEENKGQQKKGQQQKKEEPKPEVVPYLSDEENYTDVLEALVGIINELGGEKADPVKVKDRLIENGFASDSLLAKAERFVQGFKAEEIATWFKKQFGHGKNFFSGVDETLEPFAKAAKDLSATTSSWLEKDRARRAARKARNNPTTSERS